jgi:hypothetical protein
MILAIFCIAAVIVGGILHLWFRRFSWIYLVVSIFSSAAGFEGMRFALGEVRPFPPTFEYISALIVWDFGPWFLFAFLPLQLGYFVAMLLAPRFPNRSASGGNPH